MKKTVHYGADLDWVQPLAEELEGRIDGNFIRVPEKIHTGSRYYLDCTGGIVALYLDVVYHNDITFIIKNKKTDFITLYYNLSEEDSELIINNNKNNVGIWAYNLSVLDSTTTFQHNVKAGTKTFILFIFIKKETINSYIKEDITLQQRTMKILNPKKSPLIDWGRMSSHSQQAITELRKLKVGGTVFDLNLMGTVQLLIANYLFKISDNEIITQLSDQPDLPIVIEIQKFLTHRLNGLFPGNETIARKYNISGTKLKCLFKQITGQTANSFFMESKLFKAKEILEKKELSIEQISEQFNFSNQSHFTTRFKKQFRMTPKEYLQQL
ncbi:helix-turn-helix domain-containing protein [Flavobacterium sp. LAR06]|uniref:helix-turn-helix domain-containing protein n=1 Tax=Flavobacterium sp. LAR06 TaxID=3064897 RepID=UPI0035C23311